MVNKVSPLIKTTDREDAKKAYLIYQDQPRYAAFMDRLFQELQNRAGYGGMVERLDRFEDPYTFIFAVMLDRVEKDKITQVNTYAREYWEAMEKVEYEALHHRRFHVFRCEQESANIEKIYYDQQGDYTRCRYPAPMVYRLLEYPERVKGFIKAQVFNMIWFETDPRSGKRAWVLTYQPKTDSVSIKEVFERKTEGIVLAKNQSGSDLLEAISGFVLRCTCLERPAIAVSHERVDKALSNERVQISGEKLSGSDRWEKKIMQMYQNWLDEITTGNWWDRHQTTGNDWERKSLRIIYEHYLREEIEHWHKQIE